MKLAFRILLPLVSAAALTGCPAESPEPPPAATAPVVEAPPTPGVRPAGSARAVASATPLAPGSLAASGTPAPVPGAAPGAAPAGSPGGLTREAFESVVEQAAAAAEGATDCERAYAGMQIVVQTLSKRLGGAAPPPPAREPFLAACADLAPEAQRCMVIAYGREHRDECRAILSAIPPEKMARFRDVSRPQP